MLSTIVAPFFTRKDTSLTLQSVKEHHFRITKTARFCTVGLENSPNLLFVLHGYGQLATRFISKFNDLVDKGYYVVAPEGLHRFYVKGHEGFVGASWMTKEERSTDIADYIHYLNSLYDNIMAINQYQSVSIIGFSQGVATAFRWIADGHVKPKQFVIASGVIPPDLDLALDKEDFENIKLTYITGDDDPFKDHDEVARELGRMNQHGLSVEQMVFRGGHRIDCKSILKALKS